MCNFLVTNVRRAGCSIKNRTLQLHIICSTCSKTDFPILKGDFSAYHTKQNLQGVNYKQLLLLLFVLKGLISINDENIYIFLSFTLYMGRKLFENNFFGIYVTKQRESLVGINF